MDDLLPKFASHIAAATTAEIINDPTLGGRLLLGSEGPVSVCYAPFDYINSNARIVIVGLTPGRQQAVNALLEAHRRLRSRASPEVASRAAKETASFSGPMRANLVAMLDSVGVADRLGLRSCSELFGAAASQVHYTSALRYPVFNAGRNYSGSPDIAKTPLLADLVRKYLAAEAQALSRAIWAPLGPVAASALRTIAIGGTLDQTRILEGFPHPSGANNERIAYFLGRKPRASLSRQTNASSIDAARERIRLQVERLA